MYCSYHPSLAAKVECNSCNRGLCTSCDHRIKGFPYCQDCIVAGIQSLQRSHPQYQYQKLNQPASGKAILAALCALIPGAGAIYNRQNLKAVVHFVSVIGLFQMVKLHFLGGLFFFGGLLFYFYSILDAYRTARALSQGANAAEQEAKFKHSLVTRAPAIGVGLIIAGLLVFVQLLQPFNQLVSFSRIAPVALILLGGYLLTRYFKQSRDHRPQDAERPGFYLVSDDYAGRDTSDTSESSRFGNYR